MSEQKHPGKGGQKPDPKAGEQRRTSGEVKPPPRTATAEMKAPAHHEGSTGRGAALPHEGAPAAEAPLKPGEVRGNNPFNLTAHQKQIMGSAFADSANARKRSTMLGTTDPGTQKVLRDDDDDDEPTSLGHHYDGVTAPSQLTGRDVWKAVQAPVQSREGRRSVEVYEQVIKQFAVATNPRYDPDAPGKPRGHIFVWDISRAMNCEIPHFVGAKELSLAQTCDWLRHEGPMRGWRKIEEEQTFEGANEGYLVIAIPKDVRTKFIAIVAPQPMNDDARPQLLGAALKKGAGTVQELFGVRMAEFFVHP